MDRTVLGHYVGAITAALPFIPRPQQFSATESGTTWHSPIAVLLGDDEQSGGVEYGHTNVVARFVDRWALALGFDVVWLEASEAADASIVCRVSGQIEAGYRLTTSNNVVVISAADAEGCQWALTTLEQLLPSEIVDSDSEREYIELTVPGVEIVDFPEFVWRGAHLDVARHFFDVGAVARFIDLLALHKLNVLHLHLNDDQGWRLEIPGWPRLSTVGSRRSSSPLGHESHGVDDHLSHGGFYRASDIRSLVAYAADRFVTIVPEIDVPGHVQALLAAYPRFANDEQQLDVATRWGVSDHVLNLQPATFEFADELLRYVGELFPSPYLHIGGDECPTNEWRESPAAQRQMVALGVTRVEEIQGRFTDRLSATVESLALVDPGFGDEQTRRAVAWDEVLEAGAPRNTIVMAWRHSSQAVRAAEAGHDVVMTPMQFTYFDWPQSDSPTEPVALMTPPWPTSLEKVYRFKVLPPGLDPSLAHRILGAQAQHWSEYIATVEHLDYMAFPRLAAFSEVVWGTAEQFAQFRPRLAGHLDRLRVMGVHYRPLDPL